MIKLKLLLEVNSSILYHGRKRKHSKYFDISTVGDKEANDKEGPGIYLTTDKDDARGYAVKGGVLLTVENHLKTVVKENDSINKYKNIALKLIKVAPKLKDTLTNWGYDPPYTSYNEVYNNVVDSMIDDNAKDTFLNIWYDLYYNQGESVLFVKNMAKFGIDGLAINRTGAVHFVVYNPSKLKIISIEDVK